jgi:hypothetical protein
MQTLIWWSRTWQDTGMILRRVQRLPREAIIAVPKDPWGTDCTLLDDVTQVLVFRDGPIEEETAMIIEARRRGIRVQVLGHD